MEYQYDVALSFAGENRVYVQQVAQELKDNGISVFYDEFEQVDLWGKDLGVHFAKVYGGGIARYCVPFISEHYAAKVWTNYEIRNALSKAIESKDEYILPARFDETEIEGIRTTISYINLDKLQPQEFAHLIIKKLRREVVAKASTPEPFIPVQSVLLSVETVMFNDGRRGWPPACLTVTIVNTFKESRYFREPFFRIEEPVDGKGDSFTMSDQLQSVEFPKKLEHGQQIQVTYIFREGALHVMDNIWPKESDFFAVVQLTTGEELISNKRKISEVRKAMKYD